MFGCEFEKCFILSVVAHKFLEVVLGKGLVHRSLAIFCFIFGVVLALESAFELIFKLFLCDDGEMLDQIVSIQNSQIDISFKRFLKQAFR